MACANLGAMYADGLHVPKDEAHAGALLERACKGGSATACERLEALKNPAPVAKDVGDELNGLCEPGTAGTCYDSPPKLKKQTRPDYPDAAFHAGLEGVVIVEMIIGTSGRVLRAKVLQSVPGLDEAALTCVRQWKFDPAKKNGRPVPVVAQAPVNFRIFKKRR